MGKPRSISRHLRTNFDWIMVILIGILLLIVVVVTLLLFLDSRKKKEAHNKPTFQNETVTPHSSYPLVPPDPTYPPPAKEQRNFYLSYKEGDIHYSVEWSVRNVDRNSQIGPHKFTVVLYNSLNKQVTYSTEGARPFTIGCIARDGPYRTTEVKQAPIAFEPYETKRIELLIDVSCMYLGSADGKYFWRIY